MCANCMTTAADVLLIPGGVAAYAASRAIHVVRGRRRGETKADRQQAQWEQDAAFLRTMGHDPAEVLGPPPRA